MGGNRLDQKPGEAIALSALMQRGTTGMDAEALADRLDEAGIQYETAASNDGMTFQLAGPCGRQARNARSPCDVDERTGLRKDDLDFVKKQLAQGTQATIDGSPAFVVSDRLSQALFPKDHPYAYAQAATGAVTSAVTDHLPDISVERLRDLYKTVLRPENIVVSGVGDITLDELAGVTQKLVQKLPAGKADIPVSGYIPGGRRQGQRVDHAGEKRPLASRNHARLACPGCQSSRPPWRLQVLDAVLSGGMSARLFQTFRESVKKPSSIRFARNISLP